MRFSALFVSGCMAAMAIPATAMTPAAQPEGLWMNPSASVAVRTGACGDRLCGWVVWVDASAQQDARDSGITSIVGTRLLEDYQQQGRHAWSGTVYVPDMGRRFASQIEQPSPSQLKIKGCVLGGLICRSQMWTRIERLPHA